MGSTSTSRATVSDVTPAVDVGAVATQVTLAATLTELQGILAKLNASLAVTGTFFPATQPVSLATAPTTPVTHANLDAALSTTLITAGDMRISATATLTAGTRTKDTNPIARRRGFVPATQINYPMVADSGTNIPGTSTVAYTLEPLNLVKYLPGEWPLVLVANEGLVLEATVPATGVWEFGIEMEWFEIATTAGYN